MACAAALAVQRIIQRDNILENVQVMGQLLESELRQHIAPLPYVSDVRGRGLFWAVEFMEDPSHMTPFQSSEEFSNRIVRAALDLGLNLLGNLGKTGEIDVELVIISPPYIVTAEDVHTIVTLLGEAILRVAEEYSLRHGPIDVEDRQDPKREVGDSTVQLDPRSML